jgi:hypothetical protein
MFNLRTRYSARLHDELTASHTVLRHEAAMCLRAVAAIGDGRATDVDRAATRFHDFLRLASGYCEGRRTLLWPLLGELFPSAAAELMLLTGYGSAVKSDLSAVNRALDLLLTAEHAAGEEGTNVAGAALDTLRPAKILHDSLSLYLGEEELVLRELLAGLSIQQIASARKALEF